MLVSVPELPSLSNSPIDMRWSESSMVSPEFGGSYSPEGGGVTTIMGLGWLLTLDSSSEEEESGVMARPDTSLELFSQVW
jgi:hypothetical protein